MRARLFLGECTQLHTLLIDLGLRRAHSLRVMVLSFRLRSKSLAAGPPMLSSNLHLIPFISQDRSLRIFKSGSQTWPPGRTFKIPGIQTTFQID